MKGESEKEEEEEQKENDEGRRETGALKVRVLIPNSEEPPLLYGAITPTREAKHPATHLLFLFHYN